MNRTFLKHAMVTVEMSFCRPRPRRDGIRRDQEKALAGEAQQPAELGQGTQLWS